MIVSLIFLFSTSAFAISDKALVKACHGHGLAQLAKKAESSGCTYSLDEARVENIDNRWYNPSKYFWMSMPANCPNGLPTVDVMIQYYFGKCI